ncbi:S8 family serine peptidase [Siphonobacter curvatus]|uniref:Peptidase S8/S53 domain-containing protein n=1 Tax=Siphonobacter curvatus TaxID=2094562 RepID=A0A2S7IEW0_9BACT|nr:S8 family serine peptidase [Siphonobacter curvatus]PQA53215.1 hypothetical protein C5O19_25130 [Siphonobacter curvatus]
MKKKTSTLTIVLILISICSSSFAQEIFMWAGKKKVILKPDSSIILAKVAKGASINDLSKKIINNPASSDYREISIGGVPFVIYKQTSSTGKLSLTKTEADFSIPLFYANGEPMYFNGKLMLMPKKGVSIERIVKFTNNQILLTGNTPTQTYFCRVTDIDQLFNISNNLHESGLVEWCVPSYLARITSNYIPSDDRFPDQYYLHQANNIDINAPEAWDITRGCGIRVAVIDDGVEDHPELGSRLLQGFTPLDPNGFGRPFGVCFDRNTPDPFDPNRFLRVGHGMACTGIIAAAHDNGGVAGIAPNSLIYPVNIFRGGETPEEIVLGINNAWRENAGNADIISCSWGFNQQDAFHPGIAQEITNARTQGRRRNGVTLGCIVIFSSGNSNLNFSGVLFPGNVDGVITVGAIEFNGNIHGYSSRGPQMDLVACSGADMGRLDLGDNCIIPNGDIRTIDRPGANGYSNDGFFNLFNGTSAAAPQVSGVAALMLSLNPNLTETQVRTLLQQTAVDMGNPGFDNTFGFGRVNARAALEAVMASMFPTNSVACSNATFSLPAGYSGATWITSSNLQITGGQNSTSISVSSATTNEAEEGWIQVTANSSCGSVTIRKSVWVGRPRFGEVTMAGSYLTPYFPNTICQNQNRQLQAGNMIGATGGNYSFTSNTSNAYFWNPTTTSVNFNSGYLNGSFHIRYTATNSCGSTWREFPFTVSCASYLAYKVYPNPASDKISVEFEQSEEDKLLPESIELYQEERITTSKPVRSISLKEEVNKLQVEATNSIYFDVKDLPRGRYVLRITKEKEEDKSKQIDALHIILN